MNASPVLLIVTVFLPLGGAIAVPLVSGNSRGAARWLALAVSLVALVLASILVLRYPAGTEPFAVTDLAWLGSPGGPVDIRFSLGLDGLSLWLFGLSALLTVVAVLVSWEAIQENTRAYYGLLLLLETAMLGVFAARDIILFYIFFEFTLVPLFFLIGIWGSEERRHAAIKFFLFTLAGSLLMFIGMVALVLLNYSRTGTMTFSVPELTRLLAADPLPREVQTWIFLALFAGFAVKVPLFPLHTWLPLAHTEAPTAGSVLLAGVLLKIGVYGFLRFSLPMLPDATAAAMPWLLGLSVVGILYGALVALAQDDIKRMIAYSSVSHLGFCMLGVFALNRLGTQGGVLQMVNHGLSTGGLFAVVGMLYERYHTRKIKDYGGMARRLPVLAFFMLLMTLSSIGLPGLNGFAGEFILLVGMFQRAWTGPLGPWSDYLRIISVLAVSGVILGAWYMLWMIERVFFNALREPVVQTHGEHHARPVRDLCLREVLALAPLAVFILWIGLQPQFFLQRMAPTVDQITARPMAAVEKQAIAKTVGWDAIAGWAERSESHHP